MVIAYLSCGAESALSDNAVDFGRDIRPILAENCFRCHGPDEKQRQAGLRLDSFEGATKDSGNDAAIIPGDVLHSKLIYRIFAPNKQEVMPPPESKRSLTESEKQALRDWVAAGAPYEEHWSFVPPVRPEIPTDTYGGNPIDAFIGARLRQEGLDFSPEASPERLIRRVTLDLTGLPPTIADVDAFVQSYTRAGDAAYEALVDRLMGSPRYGETMALPWLDASRYADTDGYQFDGPRYMWRWRDWVIDAYNAKMPFDQFTIEQLAGDLLPNPTLRQVIATGFNRNHRYNSESGLVVEEFLLENAVDRVDTTSTLWMGLTIGCARCHDHKYDPITQREYYGLIAFFNSIPEAGRAIKQGNSEPVVVAPTKEQQSKLEKLECELVDAESKLVPSKQAFTGEVLIDRKLADRFPLDSCPDDNAKSTGAPRFQDRALILDGQSTLELHELDKALSFRADQEFTVSCWLKADDLRNSVIASCQNPSTTRPGIEIALVNGGQVQFDLITRWLAGTGRATSNAKITPCQWVHLAVTNDGSQSSNGQHIFVNGEQVDTFVSYNTNSNVGGVDQKRPLTLGGGIRPGSTRFRGAIRDLRIYHTALWPEEIKVVGAVEDSACRSRFAKIKPTKEYERYTQLREELERYRNTLPTVMVMQETPRPKPTFVRNRGVYNDYGEKVERDVPARLPPLDKDLPRNRLGFAKWLVSSDHPLTARVAVNRYWQKYFGTGIVKTAEDFGVQGEPPSHPGLLDWLATQFMRTGWDVAGMQKLILSSRTYRQQSRATPELLTKDPENRLLARGPRLRLSGHTIRDQALFVSGLLVERIGGPSVSPYQPANLWAEMSMGTKYEQSQGEDLYRRSLYTIWKRTVAPPAMAVFDAADREACWVNRKQTNTPLQALTLLNETGFVESARHFATRMLREGGDEPIVFGFRAVTGRFPREEERRLLANALSQYRWEYSADAEQAEKLITVGESAPHREIPPEEVAAYATLANVLLNLDEVVTKE